MFLIKLAIIPLLGATCVCYASDSVVSVESNTAASHSVKNSSTKQDIGAVSFTPADTRVLALYGFGNKLVAEFQYRLEFYSLPNDVVLGGKRNNIKLTRKGAEVHIDSLKSVKKMSFESRFGLSPILPRLSPLPFWVCSDFIRGYSPNDDKEYQSLAAKGYGVQGMPWVNHGAEFKDFCGALTLDGKVLFRLPFSQHYPDKLLRVIEVSNEGKKAVILVGEKVTYTDADDKSFMVGNPRQVYIWDFPDKIRVFSFEDKSEEVQSALRRQGWIK